MWCLSYQVYIFVLSVSIKTPPITRLFFEYAPCLLDEIHILSCTIVLISHFTRLKFHLHHYIVLKTNLFFGPQTSARTHLKCLSEKRPVYLAQSVNLHFPPRLLLIQDLPAVWVIMHQLVVWDLHCLVQVSRLIYQSDLKRQLIRWALDIVLRRL